MLAIRMQRTGRKGHAQFRVVVQDARLTPTSGRVVARLGNYNPHTKTAVVDKEKASFYLEHGAQPSDRVVALLKAEGVKLPNWVKASTDKKRTIRNPEKLRKNRPAEEKAAEEKSKEPAEAATETADVKEEPKAEETTEKSAEKPAEESAEAPKSEEK
jgi:small subunit ribosomal protein S16